mmetsp:Transcript_15710/g.15848  ORF Transcript_15710/g.15848 Transcript_15710/m.15848 type:complete len:328 (-) Transcript_15710:65-1048(-)
MINMICITLALKLLFVYSLECRQYDTRMGASFDLSPLIRKLEQPSYTITDGDIPCTEKIEPNYTYYFNICGTLGVDNVPDKCVALNNYNDAAAVRLNTIENTNINDDSITCEITGSFSETSSELKLLVEDDPTKGLSLTYYGEYCEQPTTQRKFIIQLLCEDRLSAVPTHAYEYNHCEYTISLPSVHGCPLQCPVSRRRVCAGNGHCAYDTDAGEARCFCNRGFYGVDCQYPYDINSLSTTFSPMLYSLIITLLIIISLLVGGITILYRQIYAYKSDVENYQALQGNGGGGIGNDISNNFRFDGSDSLGKSYRNEPENDSNLFGVIE